MGTRGSGVVKQEAEDLHNQQPTCSHKQTDSKCMCCCYLPNKRAEQNNAPPPCMWMHAEAEWPPHSVTGYIIMVLLDCDCMQLCFVLSTAECCY